MAPRPPLDPPLNKCLDLLLYLLIRTLQFLVWFGEYAWVRSVITKEYLMPTKYFPTLVTKQLFTAGNCDQ